MSIISGVVQYCVSYDGRGTTGPQSYHQKVFQVDQEGHWTRS